MAPGSAPGDSWVAWRPGVDLREGTNLVSRRTFLAAAGLALTAPHISIGAEKPAGARKKMAVDTTEWRYRSHDWHMAPRCVVADPIEGNGHNAHLDLRSP